MRELNILTFSTLYPNAEQPRHGIFVEQRLRQLMADFPVRAQVVAPVPWFPSTKSRFEQYGAYARVMDHEQRNGIDVVHPRFLVIPALSWRIAPFLLYLGARNAVRAIVRERAPVNLIDAHFYYPDGVAAVMLGRELGIPVTITARGNDLSLMPAYRLPRRAIQWAMTRAAASITVCEALKKSLVDLGGDDRSITVLRNGVDLELFRPEPRTEARAALGVHGMVLLSVGHLIERKGNHVTIAALRDLPDATLVLVGDGPERAALQALAQDCGVADRVRFAGAVDQSRLRFYYSAADALVLASSREGWANVLLEAMACGTPVVATAIWGTPEVVRAPAAGVLVDERTAGAVADGVQRLFAALPERTATRAYAEQFSWQETSAGLYALLRGVATGAPHAAP